MEQKASTASAFSAMRDNQQTDQSSVASLSVEYEKMVHDMRGTFNSGRTKDVEWRRKQLNNMIRMFKENSDAITAAVCADLGGDSMRGVAETNASADAFFALDHLDEWAKEQWMGAAQLSVASHEYIRPEPKGVVLIIAPWNFPFSMCFQPLVPALAAGNSVVIKPSEMNPACAPLIASLVRKYFDPDCVKVIEGDIPETSALLNQHWDHIFYTGNGAVGRLVMQAAAKNLTPTTLELGGKSPVIVDETANMEAACGRVALAKFLNVGQICVAPDYVLVHESRADEFVEGFKKTTLGAYGDKTKTTAHWGKMVNQRHTERVKQLIETSGGQVVLGGADQVDISAQYVPPTIIINPSMDSRVMQEEIFGPVLPVVRYKNIQDAINIVNSKETPLALYVFSQNSANIEKVLNDCSSGGACVNSCLEQLLSNSIPFGGKGASGMGSYHGKFGFDELSHRRAVMRKTTLPGCRGPAFPLPTAEHGNPEAIAKFAIMMNTGILPENMRGAPTLVKYALMVAAAGLAAKKLTSKL